MYSLGIGLSDIGEKRKINEDSLYIENELGLYIVSDGIGGHAAGEVASKTAVNSVSERIRNHHDQIEKVKKGNVPHSDAVRIVEKAIMETCREIYELATSRKELAGMGCTLTLLLVVNNKIIIGHVGDTRLYIYRNNKVNLLTNDHTMAAELVKKGLMPPENARNHPYSHTLTRSVGTQKFVQVDTILIDIFPEDIILLCTDGLSGYLTDENELSRLLSGDFESISDELIHFANDSGGKDNITVIVVKIESKESEKHLVLDVSDEYQVNLNVLSSVFLFEQLNLQQLVHILNICDMKKYERGETILIEGDICNQFIIVSEGKILKKRCGEIIGELNVGESFGEESLIKDRTIKCTLEAQENTKAMTISRQKFKGLLKTRPWFGLILLEKLGDRFLELIDNTEELLSEYNKT